MRSAASKLIEWWALTGGLLLLGIIFVVTFSVVRSALIGKPIAGDFELVEVGVAIAAFSFLPYCQLTGANVSADIFTAGASPRMIAFLGLIAGVLALGFAALLLWRMSAGLGDNLAYEQTTAIMGFPIWIAYIPILCSLFLLIIAAWITCVDTLRTTRARS